MVCINVTEYYILFFFLSRISSSFWLQLSQIRKSEIDAYCTASQSIYNELVQQKREHKSKEDQMRFERSRFTGFKLNRLTRCKDDATRLFQETIVVQFYDFYLQFEKWMSDMIKLHNDLMSVQQKLIELDESLCSPVTSIDSHLDVKLNTMMELIMQNTGDNKLSILTPNTPTSTNSLRESSASAACTSTQSTSSVEVHHGHTGLKSHVSNRDENNNNNNNGNDLSANSEWSKKWQTFESVASKSVSVNIFPFFLPISTNSSFILQVSNID